MLTILASGLFPGTAFAQIPPTAAQIETYSRLHAAANGNDAAAIEKLAGEGADLDARDSYGRPPTHVAARAPADEALKAMAKARAWPCGAAIASAYAWL